MKLDKKGIELLEELEGIRLKPYLCTKGVPTIGLGNTFYENGTKVTMQDKPLTIDEAYHLFLLIAPKFEKPINDTIKVPLNQNQFNALFCFCYNVGVGGFKGSTLVKRINNNPNDVEGITQGFLNWKGKKKNKQGLFVLESRRKKEIKTYFTL